MTSIKGSDLSETPLLAVETVVLGTEDEARTLGPWRELCAEAARIIWASHTTLEGELAVAFVPGPAPTQDIRTRVVGGGYSPETKTVLIFIEALDKVTAESLRFEAAVGRPVRYKSLVFTVKACERSSTLPTRRGRARSWTSSIETSGITSRSISPPAIPRSISAIR